MGTPTTSDLTPSTGETSRRWWALGALAVGMLVIGLDLTVLNVALPTLAVDLGASTSDQQWIIDSYALVLAALLLPAGVLGDRWGRKKLLLVGLVAFGLASIGCAFAGSAGPLVAARAAMGIGAALIIPLSMAVLPTLFPPELRGKAIAIWAAALAAGIPLGPIVGGLLLEHFWWGSVFLINVPVVAIALAACAVLLPESRHPAPPPVDWLGVLASAAGMGGIVYGAIQAPTDGWLSAAVLLPILGGAALLAVFVARQRTSTFPLVDPAWLRDRRFVGGTLIASLVSFALFGVLFVVPQYLQAVQGNGTLGTGLRLLPVIGGLIVGAKLGDAVRARIGGRLLVVTGLVVLAVGAALGAATTAGSDYGFVAGWLAVVGLGLGLSLPASMDIAMDALPAQSGGVGSAAIMAVRQLAGAIGVAVIGSVLSGIYRAQLPVDGVPAGIAEAARENVAIAFHLGVPGAGAAFASGMSAVLLVCAGIALLGVALGARLLPGPQPAEWARIGA